MRAAIFTGSREWTWRGPVRRVMVRAQLDVVIVGGARGLDAIAEEVAREIGVPTIVTIPAQWKQHGRSAGPRRNRAMLNVLLGLHEKSGASVEVHAFPLPSSRGTLDMIRVAQAAGVDVVVHRPTGQKGGQSGEDK